MQTNFDVIVVGAGHAGIEAAYIAARMGAKTLLLTQNIDTIGQMSCNPAIGGIGKSHLVKEVDALGGVMAKAIDKAGIQFRVLNSRKGPAVRATRAQADRFLYKAAVREIIEQAENLHIFSSEVDDLILKNKKVIGVKTTLGLDFFAKSVVLTVGTFLGGKIHIGEQNFSGGRIGDKASNNLAKALRALPFRVERLKTGTPPRIDGRTIDYSDLTPQPGDTPLPVFSFIGNKEQHPEQINCHITYTNEETHAVIRDNIKRSAMYSGNITGVGPRYCPSIEDKIMRFADKDKHQIFIEPESLSSHEVYPNGISTSLPFSVQREFIKTIKGFENAHITRPGYAIEYDFFNPQDLQYNLETKFIENLFFAGQINGTTGYEEAAAQGIMAGINAAQKAKDKPDFVLHRSEAYIGVLIDDLITYGTLEPYRMFTSRAEYRLTLREDNADLRLTPKAKSLGVVCDVRYNVFQEKLNLYQKELARIESFWLNPKTFLASNIKEILNEEVSKEIRLSDLLKRPGVTYQELAKISELKCDLQNKQAIEQVEIACKYQGYIERQEIEITRAKKESKIKIPEAFSYQGIPGLSNEVVEKLSRHKPENLERAASIPGITKASIDVLAIYLKKFNKEQKVVGGE